MSGCKRWFFPFAISGTVCRTGGSETPRPTHAHINWGPAMRIHDRKPPSLLAQTKAWALTVSFACGLAASLPSLNSAAGELPLAQMGGPDPATAGNISRASNTNRSPDPATPAAAAAGNTNESGNGETALLLNWHSDANNIYGAILPGEPLQPQQ